MPYRRILPALLILPLASAAEYVVSPQGDDAAAGTAQAPLRTIGAAARRAAPGDLVTIRAGIYRETVVPARSGEPGRPITFRGAPGEKPVIDGSDPITGWKPWKDGIEQAPMPGDWFSRATPGDGLNLYDEAVRNHADQVFVDGAMAIEARWPNSRNLDPSFPAKAVTEKFIGKSRDKDGNWTTGTLLDEQFDLAPAQAVGAQIMLQPNHGAWAWLLTGRIAAVDGRRFTYVSRSDAGKDFSQDRLDDRSRYFLFGKLELLDAPGEWHHDKQAGVLYLKSPDGRPLGDRVAARRRLWAFDLSERSHIVIRDLAIRACSITTDRESGGDNIPYDAAGGVRYPWRNAAHGLPAEPYDQPERFRDAPSAGIVLEGIDASYLSHFTDVSGHFFCQWGQSSGIVLSGRNHRIANCRIRWSAGNGITLLGREHRALGNLIEDTGYAANDCAAIHTGATERMSSDHEIAWNTLRRTGRSALLPRCLHRSAAAGDSAWKGRIHHNDISAFGIQDWDVGGIYSAGPGRYLRFDHNWIHDAHEHVDDLGQGAFTASGIYPDYGSTWVIDHNAIWNVEWGIHLQNQADKARPAGYLVFNNTVAVRMLGGQKSMHGPYGVVRNSDAPNQETRIEDNVLVLLDQSARYKPVDFASDPQVQRVVDGNVSLAMGATGALAGGLTFPACLVPVAGAAEIAGRSGKRDLRMVAGLPVPPIDASPDRGAFAAGAEPWKAGHEAWPDRPAPAAPVTARPNPAPTAQSAPAAAPSPASPAAAAEPRPETAASDSSAMLVLGLLVATAAVVLIVILAKRRPAGRDARRR